MRKLTRGERYRGGQLGRGLEGEEHEDRHQVERQGHVGDLELAQKVAKCSREEDTKRIVVSRDSDDEEGLT